MGWRFRLCYVVVPDVGVFASSDIVDIVLASVQEPEGILYGPNLGQSYLPGVFVKVNVGASKLSTVECHLTVQFVGVATRDHSFFVLLGSC